MTQRALSIPADSRDLTWAGDRYFRLLCGLLMGYALIGKAFAYLGAPPLFVGEMVLFFGIFAWMNCANWSRILRSATLWPLLAFMLWCARCTMPFLGRYGADALRDAAVWGWGLFAIVTASLLAAEPRRLGDLIRRYGVFAKWFLICSPFTWFLTRWGDRFLPPAPWAQMPLFNVKGGDQIVHLTAVFAFAILFGGVSPWLVAGGTALTLVVNFTGRAAMVTFAMGAMFVAMLKPTAKIIWGLVGAMAMCVAVLWLLDIQLKVPGENPRYVSVSQLVQNVTSIFTSSDNENLSGSKEWRLKWWDTIMGYTFHGRYFWTGKGFGINLADDDGFQVQDDGSLRSPHNGHLTMLARAGVPGLALWIVLQLSWAGAIFWYFLRARWRADERWSNLFMFLLVYWAAFMTNAAFDVYLEGPLGGIWMWVVLGVGLGSLWIFDHCPEALDEI